MTLFDLSHLYDFPLYFEPLGLASQPCSPWSLPGDGSIPYYGGSFLQERFLLHLLGHVAHFPFVASVT